VSANGVEGYRQLSPANSGDIAEMLIGAGADVNATTDVYQGKCTALGLVATSSPPSAAGVQRAVIDVLLKHGARMDLRGSVGYDGLLVQGCLANGQPEAAEYLANRGAVIDYFVVHGGVDVDTDLKSHGDGHTGLHVAAFHGQLEAVSVLLTQGASIHAIDKTWNTAPLAWALTGWQRSGHRGQYHEVVAQLVAAGARVTPDDLEWDKVQLDPDMLAALQSRPRRRT